MKKSSIIEFSIIMVLFGIVFFSFANKASYAFSVNYEEELYNQLIESIKNNTKIYAKNTKDFFKDGKDVYLTIKELADLNLVLADEDGNVVDPRDENKILNDVKVKISQKNDKIEVKILNN